MWSIVISISFNFNWLKFDILLISRTNISALSTWSAWTGFFQVWNCLGFPWDLTAGLGPTVFLFLNFCWVLNSFVMTRQHCYLVWKPWYWDVIEYRCLYLTLYLTRWVTWFIQSWFWSILHWGIVIRFLSKYFAIIIG